MFKKSKTRYLGSLLGYLTLLLISTAIFGQTSNWTSVIETDINVQDADIFGVDILTNGVGNHIIVDETSSLFYYRMDVEGDTETTEELESVGVTSPSISGNKDNLYVVYAINNQIKTQRSTDGGDSWDYIQTLTLGTNINRIESIMSNDKLHITYERSNSVMFRFWNGSIWSAEQTVSSGENGNWPRITAWHDANDDKVYFMYKKYNSSDLKWREYNVATSS